MNTKYLIEEQTLRDIADSIRKKDGSDDTILVEEYADRVSLIDPSILEYAYIMEYGYIYPYHDPPLEFSTTELTICDKLMNDYLEREAL